MRIQLSRFIGLAALAFALSGCTIRFKGVESFNSATTPVKYSSSDASTAGKWAGDPYGNGGIARAAGGLHTETNYGKGANVASTEPVDLRLDQPEKGTGQQPGEYHVDHGTGYGLTNAPISQSTPSDANSVSAKSTH